LGGPQNWRSRTNQVKSGLTYVSKLGKKAKKRNPKKKLIKVNYQAISADPKESERRLAQAFDILFESMFIKDKLILKQNERQYPQPR
jgi:hypothetical protein